MDDALRYLSVGELRSLYSTGQVSPTEFLRATLDLVDALNPQLNAFVTVAHEPALAAAAAAERRILQHGASAWAAMPLLGVPLSVKDLTPTAGIRTTRGSLLRRDWVPEQDAPAVARLRRAGAIIFGKTNTSEYGWSAATVNRLMDPTANPWDLARTAGGSSGGAAAAVAAGLGVAGTGTDGAGSIRIPAAFCGVVGFKPTFGRIPYVPLSPERLSHVGPLGRTVADAALLTATMAGADVLDPYSVAATMHASRAARTGPLRIAWIETLGAIVPRPDVLDRGRSAMASLVDTGHVVEAIDSPFTDPYPTLVTILATAEAAGERTARDDDRADPNRLRIAAHGKRLSAVDFMNAEHARARLCQELATCMEHFDLLAMPTVPDEPFDVADWRHPSAATSVLSWLQWAPATYPFNLTGQPAVSVPAGLGDTGLPVGVQLVGAPHEDDTVLRVAAELERARPWRDSYSRKDYDHSDQTRQSAEPSKVLTPEHR